MRHEVLAIAHSLDLRARLKVFVDITAGLDRTHVFSVLQNETGAYHCNRLLAPCSRDMSSAMAGTDRLQTSF